VYNDQLCVSDLLLPGEIFGLTQLVDLLEYESIKGVIVWMTIWWAIVVGGALTRPVVTVVIRICGRHIDT
jgi:hypothetical protein